MYYSDIQFVSYSVSLSVRESVCQRISQFIIQTVSLSAISQRVSLSAHKSVYYSDSQSISYQSESGLSAHKSVYYSDSQSVT